MLELAMVLSFAVQDFADGAILLAMILLNAVLGFREQLHAKRALDELTAGVASEVPARRDGAVAPVDVEDLVPGDVILIVGGDKVPADVTWRAAASSPRGFPNRRAPRTQGTGFLGARRGGAAGSRATP